MTILGTEYYNRPAGGFTIDVYNYAHSIDLYRGYAAIVAEQPSQLLNLSSFIGDFRRHEPM